MLCACTAVLPDLQECCKQSLFEADGKSTPS